MGQKRRCNHLSIQHLQAESRTVDPKVGSDANSGFGGVLWWNYVDIEILGLVLWT